jgi:putative spermidine/putrescine transport system permease protein
MRKVLWILAIAVCIFLVAPAFVVIPLSLSESPFLVFPPPGYTLNWYREFLSDPTWTGPLLRSLIVAAFVVLLSLVLGTATAYAQSRGRKRVIRILGPFFVLPMVVPSLVFAVGAFLIATKLNLIGSLWLVVVGHTILALPFVVVYLGAAFQTSDHRLEQAAQTLGAPRSKAFLKITLPLITPAVVASGVIAGLLSLDETVFALFLTSDSAPTLPVRMYSSIRYDLDPLVPVAAAITLAGTILIVTLGTVAYRLTLRRLRGAGS